MKKILATLAMVSGCIAPAEEPLEEQEFLEKIAQPVGCQDVSSLPHEEYVIGEQTSAEVAQEIALNATIDYSLSSFEGYVFGCRLRETIQKVLDLRCRKVGTTTSISAQGPVISGMGLPPWTTVDDEQSYFSVAAAIRKTDGEYTSPYGDPQFTQVSPGAWEDTPTCLDFNEYGIGPDAPPLEILVKAFIGITAEGAESGNFEEILELFNSEPTERYLITVHGWRSKAPDYALSCFASPTIHPDERCYTHEVGAGIPQNKDDGYATGPGTSFDLSWERLLLKAKKL